MTGISKNNIDIFAIFMIKVRIAMEKDEIRANGTKCLFPLFVIRKDCEEFGLKIDKEIASGHSSIVYDALFQSQNVALKFGESLHCELTKMKKAEQFNIGPKVFAHFSLLAHAQSSLSASVEQKKLDLVVLERLDCTLEDLIQNNLLTPALIESLYKFAQSCFQHSFLHRDLHVRNIMRESQSGITFKMIDFSYSECRGKVKRQIQDEWKTLFFNLKTSISKENSELQTALENAIRRIDLQWKVPLRIFSSKQP